MGHAGRYKELGGTRNDIVGGIGVGRYYSGLACVRREHVVINQSYQEMWTITQQSDYAYEARTLVFTREDATRQEDNV